MVQRTEGERTLATFTAGDARLSALPASREKRTVVLGRERRSCAGPDG